MRIVLSVIFITLILGLGVCCFFAFKSRKQIGKSVALLMIALMPPVFGNLFIISSPYEIISTIGCYIYFLGMDLVMMAMIRFTFDYCTITFHKKLINIHRTIRWFFIDGQILALYSSRPFQGRKRTTACFCP